MQIPPIDRLALGPVLGLALSALLLPSLAHAAQPSQAFQGRPELELAAGPAARIATLTSGQTPQAAARAWIQFQNDVGGQWTALWDDSTHVPLRIYGSGIAAPGAVADPTLAARHAGDLLRRHIDLLAPGSAATDFVLVSNEVHRGVRSVGYKQMQSGLAVVGGQVSFRFKADRLVVIGSEALPNATSRQGGGSVSTADLKREATRWILSDSASQAQASSVAGPMVLPIISGTQPRYHTVMAVTVSGQAPLGKWRVYLDAHTGAPVAREQTLRFADGTVRYNVPLRSPLGERAALPAPFASVTVNGVAQDSGADGSINWSGMSFATVDVRTKGPLVEVFTQTGPLAEGEFQIAPDGNLDWDVSGEELLDAQLSSFVHSYIAKEKVREMNPNLNWLDTPLPVNVNIDDACNAFSDGNSINFFVESSQCANTAQLADVVYHEFGHSTHAHSIIEGVGAFDGAFSEGLSDYLAATITNDPAMGLGFFKSEAPLRHIDPDNREHIWPEDIQEIHFTGLIFAGAMWDLRKLFIIQYGEDVGVALADQYFYATLQRASNIPATYVEILLEDDDDGDLANGTPNLCNINAAFGAHGLRTINAEAGNLSVVLPTQEAYEVTMKLEGLTAECPGDAVVSANIDWLLRSDRNIAGEVEMSESGDLFTGMIPQAEDGKVIRYKVHVEFADGTSKRFPDNPADPRYEFYVGEIETLYCTDFESDPFSEGWSHELVSGANEDGADDWTWGVSAGGNSDDPSAAYSGENVVGNDLGGDNFDGRYQSDKINSLSSPRIDIGNFSDVRLQYRRWLNVEDGFFDRATIYSNDNSVWNNFDSMSESGSTVHHLDREWRFHDVSLAGTIVDGTVQLKYELDTDAGLEFGGWTIDDFCIVANVNAVCGDAKLFGPEECDDGEDNSDDNPDACRANCLLPTCGDGIVDTGESCDDGNNEDGDGCESTCLLPGAGEGDCGCVVGASGTGSPATGVLGFLGFLGLLMLRRRRCGEDKAKRS